MGLFQRRKQNTDIQICVCVCYAIKKANEMESSNTGATNRVSFDLHLRMVKALKTENVYIHSTS